MSQCHAITKSGSQCKRKIYSSGSFCFTHQETIKPIKVEVPILEEYVDDEIFGKIYFPPPKESNNKKYSSFILTVNTNRVLSKLSNSEKREFLKLAQLLSDKNTIHFLLLDYKNKDDFEAGISPLPDSTTNLTKLKIIGLSQGKIPNLELGGKQKRVHIHMAIFLEHTGFYKLDVDAIKKLAESKLSFPVIVNVAGGGSDAKQIRNYVLKGKKYQAKK